MPMRAGREPRCARSWSCCPHDRLAIGGEAHMREAAPGGAAPRAGENVGSFVARVALDRRRFMVGLQRGLIGGERLAGSSLAAVGERLDNEAAITLRLGNLVAP